jgi:predicted permease
MMFWKRLEYLLPWRRRVAERDMREELRSIAAMAPPAELGNLTLAAEDARAQWEWIPLEQIKQDLRYAFRTLRKSPGFTVAAVLSLAIGIGANTSLFTLINTVTWKLLPVRDPDGLLVLGHQGPSGPVSNGFSYPQYELIRDHTQGLAFAAYSTVRLNVSIDGAIEPTLDGQLVTGEYFPLLGVHPVVGRLLGPDDNRTVLGHPVAVLSHDYWRRRFGADQAVLGRQIAMSGVSFTIVGVTPPEFFGTEVGTSPKIYAPIMMQPAVMPNTVNLLVRPTVGSSWTRVLARLEPGVSVGQARARLDALAQVPETDWRPIDKFTRRVMDLRLVMSSAATGLSDLRRQFSQPLLILLAIAGLVLLAACANVGNLLLARSAARRSEFAVRLALGSGRSRLIRQVLIESLVLAGLAGLAGVTLAFWMTRALVTYAASGQSAIALDLSPDLRVLAFTAVVSVIAGLLFGTVPACRASRSALTSDRRRELGGVRQLGVGRGPGRTLVVVQVAVSLVLLVGAGLFVRTLQNLTGHESDLDQSRVLIVRVEPRGSAGRTPAIAERFDRMYHELLTRVAGLPGASAGECVDRLPALLRDDGDSDRQGARLHGRRPASRRAPGGPRQRGVRARLPRGPGPSRRPERPDRGRRPPSRSGARCPHEHRRRRRQHQVSRAP